MRIQNKHEYKNYLGNQRIAYIQKGNRRLHTLIQFVNNDLVDKLVIESNKEVSNIRDPYKTDTIQSTLLNYNARATESKLVVTIDKESLLLALKRITPASNDISNSILFSFSDGNLTLSADNAVFGKSAKETVPCDCEGCMNICFKGSNVIDILRNIDDNDIVIEFTDENKAGVFYSMFSHTKDEYISMCMPMLIQ